MNYFQYKCDLSGKCIKPTGIQGGRPIKGEQYRTISCFWGNKPCNGYNNKKEYENICLDYDVRNSFCDDPFSTSWKKPPPSINLPRLQNRQIM